jgi:hypothetical protein
VAQQGQGPAEAAGQGDAALGAGEAGDPQWGFKFTPPAGWKWQREKSGILLGHDTIPGLIWVFPHDQADLQAVARQMQEGLSEEGVLLSLAGPVEPQGNSALVGEYTGMVQGEQARGRGIGTLSPYGGGAYILAVTTPDKFGRPLMEAADAIARAMRYLKVDVSDLVRHFAGRWASYSGGAGGGTLVNYTLFPDGSFSDQSETSYSGEYSSDGWSSPDTSWGATGVSSARGRWKVRGNKRQGQLILSWQDGSQQVINYQVFVEKGNVYWREYLFDGRHFAKQ